MEKMLRSLSAKSDTASAIRYALSHWRALTRYVDDGLLEIDNSSAERALRAVSIGRKNYLFFGADSGGARAASFYTLIGTALCRIRHRADHAVLLTMQNDGQHGIGNCANIASRPIPRMSHAA
jgi:hypothetical protein